jgi:predicted RNA methylase
MDIDIQNLTALDVCAGTGFGAKALVNKGFKNVIAVDTDKKNATAATSCSY